MRDYHINVLGAWAVLALMFCLAYCNSGCIGKNKALVSALANTASAPAKACIEINKLRPSLLRIAGDEIVDNAMMNRWSKERLDDELYLLHHADAVLRGLVGSEDVVWSECRVATEAHEKAVSASRIDMGEYMEGIVESARDVAMVYSKIVDTLSVYRITDLRALLDASDPGLGGEVAIFLGLAKRIIEMQSKNPDRINVSGVIDSINSVLNGALR
jgi:hypothetical protein